MLLQAISAVFSVSGIIDCLEKFLLAADITDHRRTLSIDSRRLDDHENVIVTSGVVLDIPSNPKPQPIDLEIKKHTVTMVIGPLGCEKSTFLRTLLGEATPRKGSIATNTTQIAHCSPEPWLRNDTIKNGILHGREWDSIWYETVIEIFDLRADLVALPLGDQTNIGSRGVLLSGGQRHRVALARALYSRFPLLLLDDCFASLDRGTKDKIAETAQKTRQRQRTDHGFCYS